MQHVIQSLCLNTQPCMASQPSSLLGTSHRSPIPSPCWKKVSCKSAFQKFTKAACHPIIMFATDGYRTSRKSFVPALLWLELALKTSPGQHVFPQLQGRPRNSKPPAYCGKHTRTTFPSTEANKIQEKRNPPNNADCMP